MPDRDLIKQNAKNAVASRRWLCIGAFFLCSAVAAAVSGASFGLLALFVGPAMEVGRCGFAVRIWRGEDADVETIFFGFRQLFRNVGTMLLTYLSILLWSFLLVIPGVIRAYSLRLVPYILADSPDIRAVDALRLSEAMTSGKRMELFLLDLSFLGWRILDLFTFGLLSLFYVTPWYEVTMAGYYDELSRAYYADPRPYGAV